MTLSDQEYDSWTGHRGGKVIMLYREYYGRSEKFSFKI